MKKTTVMFFLYFMQVQNYDKARNSDNIVHLYKLLFILDIKIGILFISFLRYLQ